MRVGEVARRTGVGVSTLRAWERRFGILEPARSSSGQRLYTEVDVDRVVAVCRLLAEGLTLRAAAGRVATAGAAALSTGEGEALLLHQVMQAADAGIWVSQDGHTRYANRRMAELMRCSIDELLARPVLDFIDPEYLDTVRERGRLVREGHRQTFEVVLRRPDASSFLAEVSTTPLREVGGAYTGAVASVSDVTARNHADAEARFRSALLDAIGEAVLAARPDGTIVYANPATERLLGWRPAELIGQNGLEILSPPDDDTDALRIHSRLLTKRRHSGEVRLTRRDGTEFVAHMTGAPVLDHGGELVGLIGVLSDSSERNRLAQEVRTFEQQAETIALLGASALRHRPDSLHLILNEAVEATRRVLQSDHAALFEVRAGGNELDVRASSPPIDEPIIIPVGSRSFAGYTALARKVVLVQDARRERRCDIEPMPGQLGVLSAIAAPVFGPSGVSGVLTAGSTKTHKFDRSAVHFMQSIANVVGTALQQAGG
jgi:PAS domain S-box-containing protein